MVLFRIYLYFFEVRFHGEKRDFMLFPPSTICVFVCLYVSMGVGVYVVREVKIFDQNGVNAKIEVSFIIWL